MVWLWVVVVALVVVVGALVVRRRGARPAPTGRPDAQGPPTGEPGSGPAPGDAGPAVLGAEEQPVVASRDVAAAAASTSADPELLLEEEATAPADPEPPAAVHGGDVAGQAPGGPGVPPPPGFTVKGNVGSMLYHTPDSPYFARTRAEVWFNTEEAAREAGFARWDEG